MSRESPDALALASWHAPDVAIVQWAPWASVFIGGCLTGAALLSLYAAERAPVPPAQSSAPQPSEPSATEDEHPPHQGNDPTSESEVVAPTTPPALEELASEGDGQSAAEVLAGLEQAYQDQLSAREAPTDAPSDEAAPGEPPPASPGSEIAPLPIDARGADVTPVAADEQALAQADPATEEVDIEPENDELAPAQQQVQQVAVVNYQPVYVLSGAAPTSAPPPKSSTPRVGLDPWAPIGVNQGQNPWSGTGVSTSVRGSVWYHGTQGTTWGLSFGPKR